MKKRKHDRKRLNSKFAGLILITLIVVGVVVTFGLIPRIPQWSSYHHFSDVRQWIGMPNFLNVVSNLLFILMATLGFYSLGRQWRQKNLTNKELTVFFILFTGIFLIGFGSSYYHWSPDNARLVWDRLPMTLIFMSLLSLTIMERVNFNLGFWLLIPLLACGVFSVLYWYWSEISGHGDLRLYGLVQFYSVVLIVAILILFPKPYPPLKAYLWIIFFYSLAKLCEHLDVEIYNLDGIISGHSLKHIFAAMSTYGAVMMLNSKKTSES
ncbi:ceramidase domain-containing protein [Legionella cardiaca]|uniref:Ceramidase domain-containing protein n=1 Tax=Legionella cardiaca TaxID=1071983 RepID=A0ABY8AR63_9GAMM|nr:ceramidase domain-containing protein [Legionella cardiaca]WED42264.1 ceramidase domain-containing protein [Legionella cardiaca]